MSVFSSGRGSSLIASADGYTYIPVGQLRKFPFSGKKLSFIDTTHILTPAGQSSSLATRVDSGEVAFDGVLDPNDAGVNLLNTLQDTLALGWFRIKLPAKADVGVIAYPTMYDFQAYVSELVPAALEYSKIISFSGKLKINGAIVITLGTQWPIGPGAVPPPPSGGADDMGPTITATTSQSLGAQTQLIEAYGGGGAIVLTLLAGSGAAHPITRVLKMDATGTVTLAYNSGAQYVLENQDQGVALGWDGSQWVVLGGN